VVEKSFKSVPDVVECFQFRRAYARISSTGRSEQLIAYGLSLAQIEQQLTKNNTNAGGSLSRRFAADQCARSGLVDRSQDIAETVLLTKNGTPLHVRMLRWFRRGRRFAWGRLRKRFIAKTERLSMTTMWFPGSFCCEKAPRGQRAQRHSR